MLKCLIVIVALLCSCQSEKKETTNNTIVFSKFPTQENITLHNFIKYENGLITKMFLRDTSIIVYDWRGTGGYFFYEYGLNSKKIINRYVPHGRIKGKGLGALSVGIHNDKLWMYDIMLSKILIVDLQSTLSRGQTSVYKEYPFTNKYYNIQFLNTSKIVANGNYDTPNILQEIDLSSGKITSSYGELDSVPKDIPFYAWKRANESLMLSNSSSSEVVLANLLNDNLEIFDLNTHKSIKVKGPENYKKEFMLFKSPSEKDKIQRNEKSRVAFVNIVATDKYIYALYSGDNKSNPNSIYGKFLYVYNWDGKPIKKINLKRYVSSLAVSNDDKILYIFDVGTNQILKTKI